MDSASEINSYLILYYILILYYLILSFYLIFVSYPLILSYLVFLSYLILSYLILSYLILPHLTFSSHLISSHHILSYLILYYHFPPRLPLLAGLLLAMTSCASASAAASPRARPARSDDFSVHVTVRPKLVEFGPNEIIAVNCRVKGGTSLTDVPYVKFYVSVGDG
jgi:hypothetical protein